MSVLHSIAIAALAALASAGLVLALLPSLRQYALAHPNARSSHRVSTPQGGGIAVTAATVGIAAAAFALAPQGLHSTQIWIVLAATAGIALVGAIGDIATMAVLPRLLLHALAVVAVVASLPDELRVLPAVPWWAERALLGLAGLWFVNLTNFMDGLDWMTVAQFVPMTAGLAALGLCGALPAEGTAVAAALGGALVGFAPFNRPVAALFLGDAGSLPIGLLAGWLLVLLAGNGHLAAALILPLYYLADATLTLLRRAWQGEPVWRAHRSHFYQRATDRGYTVMDVVARVFAVNGALVVLAGATLAWPGRSTALAALTCAAGLVAALLYCFARGKP